MSDTPPWSISVTYFRGLRQIQWAPEGVSLLVGPNGSGKTTLLACLSFLKSAVERGPAQALIEQGGPRSQRTALTSQLPVPTQLTLTHGSNAWSLSFVHTETQLTTDGSERFQVDDATLFTKTPLRQLYHLNGQEVSLEPGKLALKDAFDKTQNKNIKKIIEFIHNSKVFRLASPATADASLPEDWGTRELRADGRNLLHVLATWRGAPRTYEDRFAWVERKLKEAFPELIDGLDLELLPSATVHATFYPPQAASSDAKLPLRFAADGLKVMLHHLTAVAGAEPGAVIAIDEVENHLHPFAIRKLIEAMREVAEERDLTILLTTHSPVLLDAFRECPEQVWVLEENGVGPRRLDQLFEPDWLAHFSLGQLYDRLKFGAPHPAPTQEDADARRVDPDR